MTREPETSIKHSLLRVGNGVAIALISLSMVAQCIGFVITLSGESGSENTGLVIIFSSLRFAIVPGMLCAFAKFLANAIRFFKNSEAKFNTAIFLVITLWPGILYLSLTLNSGGPMPNPVASEISESEQFLAGRDWAKENLVTKRADCPGSQDFIRGCMSYIEARRREQSLAGSDWAKQRRPAKASECKGPLHFVIGCMTYFRQYLAKPKPAEQHRFEGMTTAECKVEVNANFEALKEEFMENGNPRGAAVMQRKRWQPELAKCEQYDRWAESNFMPKAYERLEALLSKMKAGGIVTDEQKASALQDFTEMSKVRDQPYRDAYLGKAEEYFARLRGDYKEPVQIFPRISCEEYQQKINEMIKLDTDRVAAMRALKRPDGVVTNSAEHQKLNQQRIDMLWDWKYFTDGAKAAKCEIESLLEK